MSVETKQGLDASLMQNLISNTDPEELGKNLVRFFELSGQIASIYVPHEKQQPKSPLPLDDIGQISKTLTQVAEHWLSDPQKAFQAQSKLWNGYLEVWSDAVHKYNGKSNGSVHPSKLDEEFDTSHDKRFKDPDWSNNPFFDVLKKTYLTTARWAEYVANDAPNLDEHTRHKADFYAKLLSNALSPSNFLMTNPTLLKETLNSNGENLVQGMKILLEDLQEGDGELRIRQSDNTAFEVGKNLAMTPGKVVFQNDIIQLIQYEAKTEKVLKRPLLIVPPWINRFYILDLNEQKSFVKWCAEQGLSVFVISWVNPDSKQATKSFEHYMSEGIGEAIKAVSSISKSDKIHTIGYCVGGTLLSTKLADMAAKGENSFATATLFTTQVDFTHAGDLKVFVDEEQIQSLEKQMSQVGYLEGKKMANAFNMLRSNDLIWPYIVNNYLMGKAPFPFDLLYWNSDATRMPAANHSFYLRKCYLENALSSGNMEIDGIKMDLGKVKIPIFNLAAKEDHIAPAKSVFKGSQFFGGPVEYVMSGSGHIAGVINPPAKNKYQYWTGGKPTGEWEDWVEKAEEHPGSWWPYWLEWIKKNNATMVNAREIGNLEYPPIEDAPGSFVRVRS